jgi:hypothetical protein
MSTIASLKKRLSNPQNAQNEVEKLNQKENFDDARFWYPGVDKAGNNTALIRFLPAPAVDGDEGTNFVQTFRHAFQGPAGEWYIENSLTTLGGKIKDPCGEYNSKLWKSAPQEERDDPESKHPAIVQARKQKRKVEYIANILVLEDELNPENNGKLFLFRFGQKIFDKIQAVMFPKVKSRAPMIPFDPWEGAPLRIIVKKVKGYRNYDDSEFEAAGPIGSDGEIEKWWKASYSLQAFVKADSKDPEGRPYFKSYDELKERLEKVLEETDAPRKTAEKTTSIAERLKQRTVEEEPRTTKAADESKIDDEDKSPPFDVDDEGEDDELDKYMKLAKQK